jgi:hypothetical protein
MSQHGPIEEAALTAELCKTIVIEDEFQTVTETKGGRITTMKPDFMEKMKAKPLWPSIFDSIPCYGSHGDGDTPEGKWKREDCLDCQERLRKADEESKQDTQVS